MPLIKKCSCLIEIDRNIQEKYIPEVFGMILRMGGTKQTFCFPENIAFARGDHKYPTAFCNGDPTQRPVWVRDFRTCIILGIFIRQRKSSCIYLPGKEDGSVA